MELLKGIFAGYNPKSEAPISNLEGHKTCYINNRNFFGFMYNCTRFLTNPISLLLTGATSLPDPVPEQSYVTLYLSWEAHNVSVGTERWLLSGIRGPCGSATCFSLSFPVLFTSVPVATLDLWKQIRNASVQSVTHHFLKSCFKDKGGMGHYSCILRETKQIVRTISLS